MTEKEIKSILNEEDYSWIKVREHTDNGLSNYKGDAHNYGDLERHHIEETEFLINKCRELATYIKKNNILI